MRRNRRRRSGQRRRSRRSRHGKRHRRSLHRTINILMAVTVMVIQIWRMVRYITGGVMVGRRERLMRKHSTLIRQGRSVQ